MRIRYSLCLTLFTLVFLLPLLSISVSAHPGKTDANGGHTNRSTGEYHYHHGYSAHSHYDMDGDGDIDCPYDFDDQTDHNSSDRAESHSKGDVVIPNTQKGDSKPSQISFADIVLKIFEYLLMAAAIWIGSSYFLSWIFMLILGKDKGCSISMIVGAVIAVIVSIWIIIN